MKEKELTFTCSMGNFTFGRNVKLSHAKLLRDSVMGRWFSPPTGQKRLKTEEDIHNFVKTLPTFLSNIPFELELARRR